MLNYGAVYPQAILVFVITLTYSVIQPLIVIFGAIYFGIAYVVYKYKLLFGECSKARIQSHLSVYLLASVL
jgi:calcium permeable stress-gated cation channel